MGGQSFKCPKCNKWFLVKGGLREHLVSIHREPRGFTLEGAAEHTRIERDKPTQPDPTLMMATGLAAVALASVISTEAPAATPDPTPSSGGGDFGGGGSSGDF